MSFTGFSTIIIISTSQTLGSSGGSDGKESACNAGDLSSIPGLGRFPGEGNGNPLQYCLENHKDRGAWKATVHGVTKSQTRLSNFSLHFTPRLNKIHPAGWWVGVLEGQAGGPDQEDPRPAACSGIHSQAGPCSGGPLSWISAPDTAMASGQNLFALKRSYKLCHQS